MSEETCLLDRVIDYLNIIGNVNYLSINELLVGSKVITVAENQDLLNCPTSEEAMTSLVYILTKRPQDCIGFLTVLRESKKKHNHWIAEQIDPNKQYSNESGIKKRFVKAIGSFVDALTPSNAGNSSRLNFPDKFPEESLEARFGTLDSFTSSTLDRSLKGCSGTKKKTLLAESLPLLSPKAGSCKRHSMSILDGTQTLNGARARKSLSAVTDQYYERSSWTQTLLRRRPKSLEGCLCPVPAPSVCPLASFTTYRDQGQGQVFQDKKRLVSFKFRKRSKPDEPGSDSSRSIIRKVEMGNGAVKRAYVGTGQGSSEPKKSRIGSITTLLRRVSIRKKRTDRVKAGSFRGSQSLTPALTSTGK